MKENDPLLTQQLEPFEFTSDVDPAALEAEMTKLMQDNYFKNTAKFVANLRQAVNQYETGQRPEPILEVKSVGDIEWSEVQGEVVTFIDGGLGQVQISALPA